MSEINSSDIMIILKGATQMAQEDSNLDPKEEALLLKIIELGDMDRSVFSDFTKSVREEIDIMALADMLSGIKAKKAFLLALATMALADGKIAEEETVMLQDLSRELGVGKFNLHVLDYNKGEKMLLNMIEHADH